MIVSKIVGSVAAVAAAMLLVAGPVAARPSDHRDQRVHQKQVCKFERHHGKRTKVCHRVRG